ncbi:LysR family transcriptional regulator [Phormidium tenue FACHB-886]|nr:LysR family transcriptional regulator [Phormidium tenue FACHB-886]
MTLDQLKVFLAVSEHLHFTRAAEALHLTQPCASAAIRSIETEYGVKLFKRIGHHIEITQAGTLLQAETRKILAQVALAEQRLRELNDLQRGELKIGSSFSIGNYWLPKKIYQFKQQYPGITINCTLGNAEEIGEGTASGAFDLGLVTTAMKPALQPCLSKEMVGTSRLQIVVGHSHPWFGQSEVSLDDLLTTNWVMREPGSGVQQAFEQALQELGLNPAQLNVVLVLNSSEMIKTLVEGGMGAAVMPDLMVAKEIQLSILHPVHTTIRQPKRNLEMVQPIWKLRHQQRFPTKLAIAFEQMLKDIETESA